MDLQKVLDGLIELTEAERTSCLLPPPGRQTDQDHLLWMLDQIDAGAITGEKAHRWIGYVQGILVAYKITSVDEMRDLNR